MSWLISRALMEEYKNSLFSLELVAEFSAASCSDGAPSAQLNVMHTLQPFWRNDKPMDFSNPSQFGLTCAALTADRGAALLTWYLADSRARTSAQPEKEQALTASAADSGASLPASLARYDQDLCLWKTAQCSLLGDSEEFLETWPRWGLMSNGVCWERATLVHRISGSASGLWRTPSATVQDSKSTVTKLHGRSPSDPQVGLADQVAAAARGMWTTPSASDSNRGRTITEAMTGTSLVQQVNTPTKWPTPQARDYRSGDAPDSPRAIRKQKTGWSPNLNDVVLWPTPTVCGNNNRKGVSDKSGDGLATAVKNRIWPTATATAHKGWSPKHNRSDTDDRLDYTVERQAYTPGQKTPPTLLNPAWVECLMGWPIGWTDLKPLEMGKSPSAQQKHG